MSMFDGSSTDGLRRHGVGVGCDERRRRSRTPVTLLAAAAVGVSEVSKSDSSRLRFALKLARGRSPVLQTTFDKFKNDRRQSKQLDITVHGED